MGNPAKHMMLTRLLTPDDDRSKFACGDIELDRFFQRYAGQNQFRHHIGSTYVAVIENQIAGFVTVSPGEVSADAMAATLKKKLPTYPIPVLRIARLAVDRRYQRQGIGKALLRAMFDLALEVRDRIGCAGIVADAKMNAVSFYRQLGFLPLETAQGTLGARPVPLPMFLSIRLIEKAKGAAVSPLPRRGGRAPKATRRFLRRSTLRNRRIRCSSARCKAYSSHRRK
jgi:GNAT superfamily N-acetyltransferase